jgi:hypothetical protein
MLTVLKAENTLSDPVNAEYRVMSPVSLVPEQDLHFRPVQVLALNVEEGWVRDVSETIAAKARVRGSA